MNLMEVVRKRYSLTMCKKVVAYVGTDEVRFAQLTDLVLHGNEEVSRRASWAFTCCVEVHPTLLGPHVKKVVRLLKKPGVHDAVKRGTIRAMQFASIPKSLQGEVAYVCFSFLADPREAIATRVFSMSVLFNLTKENPALGRELKLTLEDHLPYASAGFRSRALRILSQLKSLPPPLAPAYAKSLRTGRPKGEQSTSEKGMQ